MMIFRMGLLGIGIILTSVAVLSAQERYELYSTDETISIRIEIENEIHYRVEVDDKDVLTPSRLALYTSKISHSGWPVEAAERSAKNETLNSYLPTTHHPNLYQYE